jgi:hypothetical protein
MKTVTALFDTFQAAQSAVYDLKAIGVGSDDISLVSTKAKEAYADANGAAEGAGTGAGLGLLAGGAGGLLTGLGVMAIPGVGPVVAAGWLASLIAGAAAGAVVGGAAGGIIGALTDSGVSEEDAHVYAEGVRRGGTLVTAHVADEQVAEAQAILDSATPVDIEERRRLYSETGWDRFDAGLAPYDATSGDIADADRERIRSSGRI